ncbi:hypothetical protein PFICI_02866 [Pestalotiopsis fici W106-1]|uniref:Uncharacterized protein n=1 Tax=Pestalotiopsis fici (strain W106-1 / CGMCC3.15140) TaxID=1229662 RepID=W3XHY5_PESFW|nr:uncharacterized protein PFICI_02866 [Pestalotiopsis fici W106-1]ETS84841.1 hypothetical protein PFICI_02866 [Pestalotiopsis fici W106-1]
MVRFPTSANAPPAGAAQTHEQQSVRSWPAEWQNESLHDEEGVQAFYSSSYDNNKPAPNAGRNVHLWQASVHRRKDGKLGFMSCQHPSPDPMNASDQGKLHVAITKTTETEDSTENSVSIDVVPVEDVPQMEAKGWLIWEHPRKPITEGVVDKNPRSEQGQLKDQSQASREGYFEALQVADLAT